MIPADVASRLQVSADTSLRQVAPAQEISDKLSGLVAGQKVMAEIQALLPNGTYRALINQRNLTLALPFSAKTGDAIELQVTESNGKLALAVVAGQESEGGKPPNTTAATLSRTGQLISDLFSGAQASKGGAPAIALNGNRPITESPLPRGPDLVPLLKQAITQSGMFYEAHQAEWVEGRLATSTLLQEPQGQLSSPQAFSAAADEQSAAAQAKAPAGASEPVALKASAEPATHPAAQAGVTPGLSADSPKATATQPLTQAPAQLVAPQTQPIVQQQLEALATQIFSWQGQVWPGQEMRWEIDEEAARAQDSDEQAANWTTRLHLALPKLGEIDAQIRLQGNQLVVAMRSGKAETTALMRASSVALRSQLDEAGLKLASIGVDTVSADDGQAGQ